MMTNGIDNYMTIVYMSCLLSTVWYFYFFFLFISGVIIEKFTYLERGIDWTFVFGS